MYQLLIGPSGSGKTHYILNALKERTRKGQKNLLWLVPEQHSFECERALLRELGPVDAARVQVLSFSRLADHVFRQVGGMAGNRLDDGTRALLMSRALEQMAAVGEDTDTPVGDLRPGLAADSDYIEQLLTLWQELRQCETTPAMLEQMAERLSDEDGPDALLTQKVNNLYRVFSAYEGLALATGADELDTLTRLAEALPESTLPESAAVFVDGFKGFTAQELRVLEGLVSRCREMTVALGTDTPGVRWPGTKKEDCRREYTLFSPVTDTVETLRRLAEKQGKTWELVWLKDDHRTGSGALKALEAGLYAPSPAVYDRPAPEVTVTPCADVYEECRYVTRCIRTLQRKGYRCRDIAVVMRSPADYEGILDLMLASEGIPHYMDKRQDLLCEPLVAYVRSALRVAVDGWRTEELLRLMKTDLWGLTPAEIAEVENYVYTWRIDGKRWEQEWTENPAGMDRQMNQKGKADLSRLNGYRSELIGSLSALRRDLRGPVTGRQFATAVYRWLSGQKGLPGRIAGQVAVLEELAQPVLADHAARLWDEVMGILDRFAVALEDQRLPASRMEDLFTMLCRMVDMGTIPQGLDAVTVGGVDRIRYNSPRAVFVLGANEGVLPAYPMGDGLLTEEERRHLKERGLPLAENVLTQCVEERYYAYMAVAAPSERLYVTYHTATETGPSPLVTMIKRILPQLTEGEAVRADGTDLESVEEMFCRLAQGYSRPDSVTATLKEVVSRHPDYGRRLAAVERAASSHPGFRLEDGDVARRLFGTDMCLSATQTDTFYKCRFRYFCQYGLRVSPRQVAKIDGRIFGTLVHYGMETLLPRYCAEGGLVHRLRQQETALTPDAGLLADLRTDVRETLEAYVCRFLGGFEEKDGRFLYQLDLAVRATCNVLWHTLVELQQSRFTPVDFELNIHPAENTDAEGILSVRLPMREGSIQVRGKVDRVDLFVRADGTAFVRVIDYKSGHTTFDLSQLTAGQSTQMLMYLYILCDNSRRYMPDGGQVRPAGVLYHPVTDLTVEHDSKNKEQSRLRLMKMDGMVLADSSVVLAMERETAENFIPATLDPAGKPKGNVATKEQFELLRGVIEKLLIQMGESLLAGDIAAIPTRDSQRSACDYCDYQAVCGRDPEDPVRELKSKKFAVAMKELEEEVTADG